MKKTLIGLTTMLFIVGMVGVASATIVDFDFHNAGTAGSYAQLGFTGDDGLTVLTATPDPAGTGLYWTAEGLGVLNPKESGDNSQVDGNGPDESIFLTFAENVKLLSATFSSVASDDGFRFYADGQTWYTDIPGLGDDQTYIMPQTIVDDVFRFGVNASEDDYYLSAVSVDTHNPTPEPATMLLFGTGLTGLAGISRRRMRNIA